MKLKDSKNLLQSALNPTTNERAVSLLNTDMLLLPSVHFIAAVTKHGKTNLAANLACTTLDKVRDKKVFVALNEETAEDFLVRCGCILTGLSFSLWKSGKFMQQQKDKLGQALTQVVERLCFVDEEDKNMGCLEDVEQVLRKASHSDQISLVLFDYLQNVYLSKTYAGKTQYELSKLFGVRLKDIGKTAACPLVVFGQLKDDATAGFKSRVEGDSWFVNNVATGIELVADKALKQSKLIVQVDRFQGKTHDEYYFQHSPSGRLVIMAKPTGDVE
jgi:replicative DNA helicase